MSKIGQFGKFMKKLRLDSNLSIDEAARKIGVGVSDIESWESGRLFPSELSAERISEVYGVPKRKWLEILRNEVKELVKG